MVIGAGAVLLLPGWPLPAVWLMLLCVSTAVMLFAFKDQLPAKIVWGGVALLTGMLVSVHQIHAALNDRVPEGLSGEDVRVRVRIESVTDERPQRQVFIAKTLQAPEHVRAKRWRIAWYGVAKDDELTPIDVAVDDEWEFTLRLRGLQGTGNPGGFDVSAWYLRTHVNGAAYVRHDPAPLLLKAGGIRSVNAWRAGLADRVRALLTDDANDSVVVALTMGFRQGVDEDFRQLLIDTGTAHLLAISGLHIGLVSAAAFLGFKWCWGFALTHAAMPISRTAFAGVLSLLVAAFYAVLAGLSPPTLRAVGMCAVGLFVIWQRRSLSSWVPFTFTLAAVVLSDVVRLLSAGVWLSFGTVALIVLLHRPSKTAAKFSIPSIWRTHAALGLCVLPISGWFFSQGSLIAPVANLLAVPWVSFVVVPSSLAVVILVAVWPSAAMVCLRVVNWAIDALEWWLRWCAMLPYSDVPITVPSLFVLIPALIGFLSLCAPKAISIRRFAVPLCLPMVVWSVGARSVNDMELHVLDVGQGHASLVLTEHHAVLVDTGGALGSGKTHWQATVLPALKRLGRNRLDHVIVSHSDSDHAAGVQEIAELFPKATFWLGGVTTLNANVNVARCQAGDHWTLDGVEFSFIYPSPRDVDVALIGRDVDDNDGSCVLLVQLGHSTVLFPGDIERRGEARLLSRLRPSSDAMGFHIDVGKNYTHAGGEPPLNRGLALQERLTVLIAPHHGSNTSSTAGFVAALQPEHVVFPAGHNNRLGFPHDTVLMRYKIESGEPYVTGRDGALQFRLGPSGLKGPPVRYWVKHRRLWHSPR